MSRQLDDPAWENTNVLRGSLADEIKTLKGEQGGDIVSTGSMSVVTQLIAQGLVDERPIDLVDTQLVVAAQPPLVTPRDVTVPKERAPLERPRAERERPLVESAPDAFVTIDSDGRVVSWNRQAERLFGISSAEARGRGAAAWDQIDAEGGGDLVKGKAGGDCLFGGGGADTVSVRQIAVLNR